MASPSATPQPLRPRERREPSAGRERNHPSDTQRRHLKQIDTAPPDLDPEPSRHACYPISMIWFSVSQASTYDSSGTLFHGWGFALRARQSNDFG